MGEEGFAQERGGNRLRGGIVYLDGFCYLRDFNVFSLALRVTWQMACER